MSVRRRHWVGPNGEPREAWVCAYRGLGGKQHIKTFKLKKHAEAFNAQVSVDMRLGVHTPERASPTVAKAAELWLQSCAEAGLERGTLAQYECHVRLHITPLIGHLRIAKLSVPVVRAFQTQLRGGNFVPGQP